MSLIFTTQYRTVLFYVFLLTFSALQVPSLRANVVEGERKIWHRISVTFDGPQTSESASKNPFTDYRLLVTFTHQASGKTYVVPGFYAADGNAAESSASNGKKWRVYFTPDETGDWSYVASFRTGSYVAVSTDAGAGSSTSFDGASGSFSIGASDKGGSDFRGKGMLRYVDGYHLQFAGSGEYYIKVGPDGPENLLAYSDFDGTYDTDCSGDGIDGSLHAYEPHLADWQAGDPSWKNGKGKGLIGALNYLEEVGNNNLYFLTYNIDGGDGCDVWPWTNHQTKERFDVSKLAQWERVFSHMDARGIQLHVILSERQNAKSIGGSNDGDELNDIRKLYYREIIARFGHHLAVQWNLGEENTNNDNKRLEFASYIRAVDPYDHPITVHTSDSGSFDFYEGLLGSSVFEATSLQADIESYNELAIHYRTESLAAGRKWAVYADEQSPNAGNEKADLLRKEGLWGNLMGGGAGVEWYFSFDLSLEDFRKFHLLWSQMSYAEIFFQSYLPFERMEPANELTASNGDFVLAEDGAVYAVYLPDGGSAEISMGGSSSQNYAVRWYNPRTGGDLVEGSVQSVKGNGTRNIGSPPFDTTEDWVALLTTGDVEATNEPPVAVIGSDVISGESPLAVQFDGGGSSDPDGSIVSYTWDFGDGVAGAGPVVSHTYLNPGIYNATLLVVDDEGMAASDQIEIEVVDGSGGEGGEGGEGGGTSDLPVVSIYATDTDAAEPGGSGNKGKIRVERTGDLSAALLVRYTVSGSAKNGIDYSSIDETIWVEAGDDFEKILILPIDDEILEEAESIILTLEEDAGYEVDEANKVAEVALWDNEIEAAVETIYRVNAGGGGISDAALSWARDTKNKPSIYVNADQGDNNIDKEAFEGENNTSAPTEIFDRSRWDPNGRDDMEWSFPVEDGTYQVKLFFAEVSDNTSEVGSRLFDVYVEDKLMLDDFDVVEEAGFRVATMKSYVTQVTDGTLNIDFRHVFDQPFVNGIEILRAGIGSTSEGPGTGDPQTNFTFDQLMADNWELVGLPLSANFSGLAAMQPTPQLFTYHNGMYEEIGEALHGQGFWLLADEELLYQYEGARVDSVSLGVSEGWNLIAGPSCSIELNRLNLSDLFVPNTLYRFDEGYVNSHRIEQGKGYWIYAKKEGMLSMSCGANTPVALAPSPVDLQSFGLVQISDREGNEERLYFGSRLEAHVDQRMFKLPPKGPGYVLDARFENDQWLTEASSSALLLSGEGFPLTLTLAHLPQSGQNEYVLTTLRGSRLEGTYRVQQGDAIQLPAGVDRVRLQTSAAWEADLPGTFVLEGNYPNPFNPETTIVFGLPDRAEVEVDVFDMLGRRVAQVAERTMEASPRQEVRISAGDLASGTYIYQVRATIGNQVHVESGTMILLK